MHAYHIIDAPRTEQLMRWYISEGKRSYYKLSDEELNEVASTYIRELPKNSQQDLLDTALFNLSSDDFVSNLYQDETDAACRLKNKLNTLIRSWYELELSEKYERLAKDYNTSWEIKQACHFQRMNNHFFNKQGVDNNANA
jgi:hypothetical protein